MGTAGGPLGARSWMGTLKVGYMNVERGCVATHVVLESCARKRVEICFVGECWVALNGSGTQSYSDYVILASATQGTKVGTFVRKDLVDRVRLVLATVWVVIIKIGGCRVGGVHGKCDVVVHVMKDWLDSLLKWVGRGDWVLLEDWNAYHYT